MENRHWANDSQKQNELVKRYKEMLKSDTMQYFDVHEFEHIIRYYRVSNRFEAALYAIEIALKQHPNTFVLQLRRVEIIMDRKEYAKALSLLEVLAKAMPDDSHTLFLLGCAHNYMEHTTKAISAFKKALNCQFGRAKIELLYSIGVELQQMEHFADAIFFLKLAEQAGYKNNSLLYDLAYCHEKTEDHQTSIDYYRRYIDRIPYSTDAWYNLAIAYNRINEPELSLDAYDFALAIDPKFASAIFNKANLLSELEEHNEAIELYKTYLELDPDNAEAVLYIGQCYDSLEDWKTARNFYQQALSIDDAFAEAQYSLALNFFIEQEFADSLYFVKKAIDLDSSISDYWLLQANINLCLGYLEQAIHSYEEAIELDVEQVEAWVNLADIFCNAGQLDVAITLLEKSYEHNCENATINFRYASYLLQNNNKAGLQQLETGLQLDPSKLNEFLEWYPAYKIDKSVGDLLKTYDIDLKKH